MLYILLIKFALFDVIVRFADRNYFKVISTEIEIGIAVTDFSNTECNTESTVSNLGIVLSVIQKIDKKVVLTSLLLF